MELPAEVTGEQLTAMAVLEKWQELTTCVGGQRLIKPKAHAGQRLFLDSDAPARVLVAHRRWGKDYACIMDMRNRIPGWLQQEHRRRLSPAVKIGVVYPTHELASEFWTALKRMTPQDQAERVLENAPRHMELEGGVLIEVRSANDPTKIVAAGYDMLIFGEAGLLHPDAWQTAHATLASPGRAGMVVFQGTPRGQNWFAGIWNDVRNNKPGWWGQQVPFWIGDSQIRHELANPHVTDEAVQREREDLTERWFRQEWLADFLTSEGAVFRNIRECVAAQPAEPVRPFVLGVDLAKHQDYTVFAMFDGAGRMIALDRMQHLPYPQQAARLCEIISAYEVKFCVIESNGPGEPFYDMICQSLWERRGDPTARCEVIPQATTMTSKANMINALVLAFEQQRITILDDPVLVNEFEAFEFKSKTGTAHEKFGAPSGMHDDCVMACALAWSQIQPAVKVQPQGKYPTTEDLTTARTSRHALSGLGGYFEKWGRF